MRTIEVMNHQIEFVVRDADGNERLEDLVNDQSFADVIQDDIYLNDAINGQSVELIVNKDGTYSQCHVEWNIKSQSETRVYVSLRIDPRSESEENVMDDAEKTGRVYSLSGFQEAFNNSEMSQLCFILIK